MAHEWEPDALAAFLVARLMRPGAWTALDDLDFRLRGCYPGWETAFATRSERELDTCQVGMVYDLVLRQHPDFTQFIKTDAGRTGWTRKVAMRCRDGIRPASCWTISPEHGTNRCRRMV